MLQVKLLTFYTIARHIHLTETLFYYRSIYLNETISMSYVASFSYHRIRR